MEPIFWLIVNGGVAYFIFIVLAAIVMGIVNAFKARRLAESYIEKGLITEGEKKLLPDALLKNGHESLAADRFGDAYSSFNDCLKLAEWESDDELKRSANFGLARYYAATKKDEKALTLLSSLFTPQAYLLKGELLSRQDGMKNRDEIKKCAKEAMKCEELQSRALLLFMDNWDGYVDGRITPEVIEQRKKFQSLLDAAAPVDLKDGIDRMKEKFLKYH